MTLVTSSTDLELPVACDPDYSIVLYAAPQEDLSHQTRVLGVTHIVLSDVTMQPVAEEQVTVVQRQNDVRHQTC
jgi:hypothetical protein